MMQETGSCTLSISWSSPAVTTLQPDIVVVSDGPDSPMGRSPGWSFREEALQVCRTTLVGEQGDPFWKFDAGDFQHGP